MSAPGQPPEHTRGFVLINALVLVAALAAATLWMLARAEDSRARSAADAQVVQLGLYLDAAEALGLTVLARDRAGTAVYRGQAWARARYDVPLDRGEVALSLDDLQGRFNLNWLANPQDTLAREGWDRLGQARGLAPQRVQAIAAFLAPGGPPTTQGYASADPATNPVGGSLLMADQIRTVPGLTPAEWARLAPVVTALPGDATLNVNTALPQVLASLLPGANVQALTALTSSTARTPFTSVDDFMLALARVAPDADIEAFDPTRLGTGSDWFVLTARATLEGRAATRQSVLWRLPLPNPLNVAYRLDNWEQGGPDR